VYIGLRRGALYLTIDVVTVRDNKMLAHGAIILNELETHVRQHVVHVVMVRAYFVN
jgi:hypothetical protein